MIELTQQEIDENAACRIRRYELWCILDDCGFTALESMLDDIDSIFQRCETLESFAVELIDYTDGKAGHETAKEVWEHLSK